MQHEMVHRNEIKSNPTHTTLHRSTITIEMRWEQAKKKRTSEKKLEIQRTNRTKNIKDKRKTHTFSG